MSTKRRNKRDNPVLPTTKTQAKPLKLLKTSEDNEILENNIISDKIVPIIPSNHSKRLGKEFFNKSSYDLAKSLLGKLFLHKINDEIISCVIIETELYPGGDDQGSVSFNGRKTAANEQVYGPPGTTWVYLTYGVHHCINISSADDGGAVLLRAGECLHGIEKIRELRSKNLKSKKEFKFEDLASGPSKLCKSLGIDKASCNGINVIDSEELWFEDYDFQKFGEDSIVSAKRIGIDRAGAVAVNQRWRFYYFGHPSVSKRDLICESEFSSKEIH